MECLIDDEVGKVGVILTFARDQLLYDIRNAAYIEGHIMPADSEHSRHTVIDIGEVGNVDRVTRVLDLAISHCRELLYPYAKREIDKYTLDDKFNERASYGIVMQVPEDFSQTTLTLLERLIHEYLVCSAVADWLSIAKPEKAETWAAKAYDIESRIRVSAHARTTRMRIRPHWL